MRDGIRTLLRRGSLVAILFILGSVQTLSQQPGRVGPEFQVNTYTSLNQHYPRIAMNASGEFVVVWQSTFQDGSYRGIFGQRFDNTGSPQGSEFQVNTYTLGDQGVGIFGHSVSMNSSGEFVVVWDSLFQDGDSEGIFGQRFDATGTPQGTEFQVNTTTLGAQVSPNIRMDSSGNFVVVWQDSGQDGDSTGVFGQRFDNAGTPQGGEFQINTYTTGAQLLASIGMDTAGNFVVVWQSNGQDGYSWGIFGQRFDAAATPQGAEFQVNTHTTYSQGVATVAMDGAGNFVVSWSHYAYFVTDEEDVLAQRFDSTGTPQGTEFTVNTFTTSTQVLSSVAMDSDGEFVVVWQSANQDGDSFGVFGQRFDSAGVPEGSEFQVNTYTTSGQAVPSVAAGSSGEFVVTWASPDAHAIGIFGQRFSNCNDLDADGFGSPGDPACLNGTAEDCDDSDATVYPGAPQICDGQNNDCDDLSWPALPPDEADVDLDGFAECENDCDDADPSVYPGASEICDGQNNDCDDVSWPALPASETVDDDSDGFVQCADCVDSDPGTYPGAPEINDGLDNQCPGDPGHGVTDEVTGGIDPDPNDPTMFCWTPQQGATTYQVARASSPDFSTDCTTFIVAGTCLDDPSVPPIGTGYNYAVRPLLPNPGSFGQDSTGAERIFTCGMETTCDDGFDDDLDGLIDCADPDCDGVAPCIETNCVDGVDNDMDGDTDCADVDCSSVCLPAEFVFTDTFGDDLADMDLLDFFSANAAGPGDYLYINFIIGAGSGSACFERADFYRENYLLFHISGSATSGSWNKWFKTPFTGNIWELDVSSYLNVYGILCSGPYAYCLPVDPPGFPGLTIIEPAGVGTCEVNVSAAGGCGDGTWITTVRFGRTRLEACGF